MSRTHNYDFALQKYMLLQRQHEELCLHLDHIRPHLEHTSSDSSASSPATSPSRASPLAVSLSSSPQPIMPSTRRHRRSTPRRDEGLATIIDEDTICEISAEERRLCDVNESIKRALTEMLNCDSVRADGAARMWVQGRLMETEKDLRSGRRRKS